MERRCRALACSPEEMQARIDLAAAYRLIAYFCWDHLIFTYLTARVPGVTERFLVGQYGMTYDEITASGLLKVDLEGDVVENESQLKVHENFHIHRAVYAAREDVNFVLHLQTIPGAAVSAQVGGLMPLNQTAIISRRDLGWYEPCSPPIDSDSYSRLVAELGDNNALLMRNMGIITVGDTVASAFVTMYFAERACAIQSATLKASNNLQAVNESTIADVTENAARRKGRVDNLAWSALTRKIDRIDPSYRK